MRWSQGLCLKVPHTEVDEEKGLEWAQLLADQERAGGNSLHVKVESIYEKYCNVQCEKYIVGSTQPCGGRTVIRSHSVDEDKPYNVYNRLFIGCERWQSRESRHTYVRLNNLDPVAVLQTWGRDRCRVHADILEELNINWNNTDEGNYLYLKYSNVLVVSSNTCHAVYANLQGPKDKKCPFYHNTAVQSESETKTIKKRGNIVQLECQVKFHFFSTGFCQQ